ncbi:hypothetical protein [Emticicia sp. C21]|uniref:hypothetical protein n=1 Tax=Emticicia sp. C21 TaxID=2302915 RepID=UPI000E356B49|nr:hypothetical protein [Emticicia sp. C21]RFS16695.1 hypothetical protein D0T08_08410 [Emticicia sp. C21]
MTALNDFIGKWFYHDTIYWKDDLSGYKNWDYKNPSDKSIILPNEKLGLVNCIDVEDNHLLIRHKKNVVLKIKPTSILLLLPFPPMFKFGEKVIEIRRPIIGVIREIGWHLKEQKYYYFLTVNNKDKSRRYFEEELNVFI